jgi:hypothetical protein
MERNGVKPYCTNLIPQCGANAQRLLRLPTLDPRTRRWVQEVAINVNSIQACQGDVAVVVDGVGNIAIDREFNNACVYRGDYAALGLP